MNDLAGQIEALLFIEGGSLTLHKLSALLSVKEPHLREALMLLSQRLESSGLTLIATDTEVTLAANKQTSPAVRAALERELGEEIGDAGLEVLAIILYRGPSTRANIDYIRGVNSSSTIRNLLARGLIERYGNPEDGREYLYRPTTELLAHLGVRKLEELPEHTRIRSELAQFEEQPKSEAFAQEYGDVA